MHNASRLAGFIAAHGIWGLSGQMGFAPMLGFAMADGKRKMEKLEFEDVISALQYGRKRLDENPLGAAASVLAYDGRINRGNEALDAILLELRTESIPKARATVAVPYRAAGAEPFRVFTPKLIVWESCGDADMDVVIEAFFAGAATHHYGAAIWRDAFDESQ